jgi:hypothetical protein
MLNWEIIIYWYRVEIVSILSVFHSFLWFIITININIIQDIFGLFVDLNKDYQKVFTVILKTESFEDYIIWNINQF